MTHEELMYASEEDTEFYLKCVEGLPSHAGRSGTGFDSNGIQIPYSCGYHSVKCLREIVNIVKPKSIFEIGTNLCCSASLWLELAPKSNILTCDVTYKQETLDAVEVMTKRYPKRFTYINRSDLKSLPKKIDLAFVDGSHLLNDVCEDIGLCLTYKIPYIAFDDIMPQFGFAQEAINMFLDQIELVQEFGNIGLYKLKA